MIFLNFLLQAQHFLKFLREFSFLSLTSFYQFLRILAILLLVPGRVQLGECFTGSASEIEEEVDTLAVVVAEKQCETAAAWSFMELGLRWVLSLLVLSCFGVYSLQVCLEKQVGKAC